MSVKLPSRRADAWLVAGLCVWLVGALAFDALEAQGNAVPLALDTMRGRAGLYDPEVLAALVNLHSGDATHADVREVSATGLCVGMIVVADVKLKNGTVLVTRGYEVTESFIERVRNYPAGTIVGCIRVSVPDDGAEAAA